MTLQYLLRVFEQRKPKRIRIAVLLDKPERRIAPVHADYVGFTIPNEFVVGYGTRLRGAISQYARCRRAFLGNQREIELNRLTTINDAKSPAKSVL